MASRVMIHGSWYAVSMLRAVERAGAGAECRSHASSEGTGSAAAADCCHVGIQVQNC